MSAPSFDPKDLTKEKRLWDIYIASKRIPFSRFNAITTALVFVLILANSWFTTQPVEQTSELVGELSKTGWAVALSTLGFLVAGFSRLAKVTQTRLSLRLAEMTQPAAEI